MVTMMARTMTRLMISPVRAENNGGVGLRLLFIWWYWSTNAFFLLGLYTYGLLHLLPSTCMYRGLVSYK